MMMFGHLSNRESLRNLIVALEAHADKVYHLGIGKSVTRSNLSKANEQRNYRIFEEFAFFMIAEARKRRIQIIFEIDSHVYAFDSTSIDLCLSVLEWAKFRKQKGGIKMHTLYDVEAQVPAFVHSTEAKVHDSKAIPEIPYEKGAHYIFDRGYNDFGNLYTINRIGAFFVVRAKTNVRYNNRHWLTDVVAGAGFGILCAQAAYWLYPVITKTFFHKRYNANIFLSPYVSQESKGLALHLTL